jgi:hypothetical protein
MIACPNTNDWSGKLLVPLCRMLGAAREGQARWSGRVLRIRDPLPMQPGDRIRLLRIARYVHRRCSSRANAKQHNETNDNIY